MTVAVHDWTCPAASSWLIEPATPDDVSAIVGLEAGAFTRPWSQQSWAEEIERHWVRVVRRQGWLVGVVAVWVTGDTADLTRVIVEPGCRRRGLGRALVNAALDHAAWAGASQVLLEVSASNLAAVELYRQLGFAEIARRRDYYGPGEAALVMRRDDV